MVVSAQLRQSSVSQVYLVDAKGNGFYRDGKIVGVDPAYDLAVLKVFNQTSIHYHCNCFKLFISNLDISTLLTGKRLQSTWS